MTDHMQIVPMGSRQVLYSPPSGAIHATKVLPRHPPLRPPPGWDRVYIWWMYEDWARAYALICLASTLQYVARGGFLAYLRTRMTQMETP